LFDGVETETGEGLMVSADEDGVEVTWWTIGTAEVAEAEVAEVPVEIAEVLAEVAEAEVDSVRKRDSTSCNRKAGVQEC
jgi:hypothetical protein